jgi:hypothetical protein
MKKYIISLAILFFATALLGMAWCYDWDVPYAVGRFVDAISMPGYAPSPLHCLTAQDATDPQGWSIPADQGQVYGIAFSPAAAVC